MRQQGNRFKSVAIAGVAAFAVVPAPIRVIVVIAHQIVNLWNAVVLHPLTDGTAKSGEIDGITAVDLFLKSEKTGKTRIGNTFDITQLRAKPCRCRRRD